MSKKRFAKVLVLPVLPSKTLLAVALNSVVRSCARSTRQPCGVAHVPRAKPRLRLRLAMLMLRRGRGFEMQTAVDKRKKRLCSASASLSQRQPCRSVLPTVEQTESMLLRSSKLDLEFHTLSLQSTLRVSIFSSMAHVIRVVWLT